MKVVFDAVLQGRLDGEPVYESLVDLAKDLGVIAEDVLACEQPDGTIRPFTVTVGSTKIRFQVYVQKREVI